MNALRGHSNIQGLTDVGLMSNMLPGYMTLPTEKEVDFDDLHEDPRLQAAAARPNQLLAELQEVLRQLPEVHVRRGGDAGRMISPMIGCRRLDVPTYDILRAFELMHQGKMTGYFCQGFNPLQAFPNRKKISDSLSKLKFLVVMDPLDTETARFWEKHGDINDVDPAAIETEVYPAALDLLCGRRRIPDQFGPLAAVALAGRDASGRGEAGHLDHGAALPPPERALQEGRRRLRRSDPQSRMALRRSGRADRRRDSPRRSTARRCATVMDPADPTQSAGRGRQARAELRRLARRWFDGLRLLDLFRLLQRERQQHGPPRYDGPGQHRRLSEVGVLPGR